MPEPKLAPPSSEELIRKAWEARAHAYVPFSGFRVGAALLAADGRIFAGCNVEGANYSLTVCAERVALLKAVSEGVRAFRAIAVAAVSDAPTPPCGSCRQLLWELCGDIPVYASNVEGQLAREWRLGALLPEAFGAAYFEK